MDPFTVLSGSPGQGALSEEKAATTAVAAPRC